MTPSRDSRAFWGFEDLALFLGAILPAWLAGLLLVRFLRTLAPDAFSNNAVRALAFQSAIYALLVGALWMVITFRYRRPFWYSMGWVVPERGKWWCIIGGPALAIGLSIFGVLLRTPPIPTPPERCTFCPICAHDPTVAHVSTIVPSPTYAPMFT